MVPKLSVIVLSALLAVNAGSAGDGGVSTRLPNNVPPELGVWGWADYCLEPDGYKPFIDMIGKHSAFGFLTTTLRVSKHELTWEETHKRIKEAAAYAGKYGIGIVMDLDVRLARQAFREAHPDELQGMLRLREVELGESGEASLMIESDVLRDHYTCVAVPYIPVAGRLVRVYSYVKGPDGIDPGTIKDITSVCRQVAANEKEVSVAIPCSEKMRGRTACVIALFDHLTPDVFAPHLIDFHRMIYKQYADAGLSGACKDEWGFPPDFTGCPAHNDFWFSRFHAAEYAKQTGGRDLVSDCLLMHLGPPEADEAERCYAINAYNEMAWRRNGEIEDAHYRLTKEVFGKNAIVATHPTWWPNPDRREFRKNGLDWWVSTRDFAQVDEVTPYCVRTALAKKWPCPLWYNMYYSKNYADYEHELWSAALAGGRINYHPVYPVEGTPAWRMHTLLTGELMRGNSRVRLLNFITKAPVDSPVAVVFGHACAANWAGPGYDDVGLRLTDALWKAGCYADLIPSSEIENKALQVGPDGFVHYGKQRYAALILYHPEFEKPSTAELIKKAAAGGTTLYQVGNWTRGSDGKPFDGKAALPKEVQAFDRIDDCATEVLAHLRNSRIEPNTPASRVIGWDVQTAAPPRAGMSRMIDGMRVVVAAEKSVAGDPIQTTITIDGHRVTVDAVGIVGIRLTKDGKLDALAAGGLKHVKTSGFTIDLTKRADIALWRDEHGKFHGVLQHPEPEHPEPVEGWPGDVPDALEAITKDWLRLGLPAAMAGGARNGG